MFASSTQVLLTHEETLLSGVRFSLQEVPGGRFMMGDNETEKYVGSVKPAHEVALDRFYIGEYEVRQLVE